MNVRQLQNLDPGGWTELLAHSAESHNVHVNEVTAEPFEQKQQLTRYWLTLADHTDRITFVGKTTSLNEAYFYRHLAVELPELVPHAYLTDVLGAKGWILLRELVQDRPISKWTECDYDKVMAGLAYLHATFWDQEAFLDQHQWLPHFMSADPSLQALRFEKRVSSYVSDHAIRRSGRFGGALINTAAALKRLIQIGVWNDVYDDRHLEALRFLLDDPLPVLQPLMELPISLLHGNPSPEHWHINLFGECLLFDWQEVYVGPPVLELAAMLEQFAWWRHDVKETPGHREQQLFEETITDTYLLQMGAELGSDFNGRQLRQSLAAARCFHILTHGLPRYTAWLNAPSSPSMNWNKLKKMDEDDLFSHGYPQLARLRRQLKGLLNRFLCNYSQM